MKKSQSLVSIIIPAYNEEKCIGRLLSSIKNQTYPKIEVIVIDDASYDKTAEIAKKYTKNVYTRAHAERSIQRNFGAEKSKGKYLVFLDADMELTSRVIEDCVSLMQKSDFGALVIPEKTVGSGLIPEVRRFEREMYEGDSTIELARFFKRDIFFEFKGYDLNLTGPEDYDLPYRISKKYKIGRSIEYILHHEEGLTLSKLLKKKYYYANKGAVYAEKHPELIYTQGTIIFRKAYLRNWRNFVKKPVLGFTFLFVRLLETVWAVAGFISAVGLIKFLKTTLKLFK